MTSSSVQNVIEHYTKRHAFRQDLFGNQPYANYGYWTRADQSIEEAAEALTDLVARTAGMGAGDHVLDVGCGYGAGAVSYTRRYHPASVIGIDITDIRIEYGREYVEQHGLSKIVDLRLGDSTHMDFDDGAFTCLIAVECAFHFDTRRDFLFEASRVLAPGGRIALTDIIPRRGVDPRTYLRGEQTSSNVCLDMPANAYDADVYAQHMRDAGFTDIRIDSIIEETRIPFSHALAKLAAREQGERGATLKRMAERITRLIELGEDYVLVSARKPSA